MKTDIEIKRSILNEFGFEPAVNAADIGVIVKDGIVTLTGTVSEYSEKRAAESMTKNISGVKGIAEEIKLKSPNSQQRTDEDIVRAVVDVLENQVLLPKGNVKVTLSGGHLILEGEVDWQYQKTLAEEVVRPVANPKWVRNLIAVKNTPFW